MATPPDDALVLPDAAAWRAWLDAHEDDTPDGVWLVLAKKGRPAPTTLTHATALEEALCSGWIDAQGKGRAETRERNAARFVEMLERGETPYPQKASPDPAP